MRDIDKNNKKIMYVVSYFPSTSQTFVLREIKQLRELGYDLKICALNASDKEVKHKDSELFKNDLFYIPDIKHNKKAIFTLLNSNMNLAIKHPIKYFKTFSTALHTKKFRVLLDLLRAGWCVNTGKMDGGIHLHSQFAHNPTNIAYFTHLLNNNSFSFTSHAFDLFVNPTLLKEKLTKSKFAVTISNFNKNFLEKKYGQESIKNLHVIRCGIEKKIVDRNVINNKSMNTKKTIFTIGRMVEKKGFDVLIDAIEIVNKQGYDIQCRIIGGGELQQSLELQVKQKGLESQILFLGPKSSEEVLKEFSTSDMFVLPCKKAKNGDMDGIPVVYMEAIANHVPVIATELSGIPELIIDGQTGLLASPGDSESLAEKIKSLLDHPELGERLAENAYIHLKDEFVLEDNVEKLSNLFDSI